MVTLMLIGIIVIASLASRLGVVVTAWQAGRVLWLQPGRPVGCCCYSLAGRLGVVVTAWQADWVLWLQPGIPVGCCDYSLAGRLDVVVTAWQAGWVFCYYGDADHWNTL